MTTTWLALMAAVILASQFVAGGAFLWDCRRSGGDRVECWREAHEMSGLKELRTGAVGFLAGFWTKNPYLRTGVSRRDTSKNEVS